MTSVTVDLEQMVCPTCSMIFYLPENFLDFRKKNHDKFCCPAGHPIIFPDPSEDTVDNLKKKVSDLQEEMKALKTERIHLIHKLEQAGIAWTLGETEA